MYPSTFDVMRLMSLIMHCTVISVLCIGGIKISNQNQNLVDKDLKLWYVKCQLNNSDNKSLNLTKASEYIVM